MKIPKGFTLIEILVALALSLIVMTAVMTTFVFQNKSYTEQSKVIEMQEGARVAMDIMSREMLMSGYIPEAGGSNAPSADVSGEGFTDGQPDNIEEAGASAVTFEADIDNDGKTETVRYAWSGTPGDSLTREVWEWSGSAWGASGGAQAVIDYVHNMNITYDDTNRDDIRNITIELTTRSSDPDSDYAANSGYRTRTLSSHIKPRNLSLDGASGMTSTTSGSTTTTTSTEEATTSTEEATTSTEEATTTTEEATTSTEEATTTTEEATTTTTVTTSSTTESPPTTEGDSIGPDITITSGNPSSPVGKNDTPEICAIVTDASGEVASVKLITNFETITMAQQYEGHGSGSTPTDEYCATIPRHRGETVTWYIEATDDSENITRTSKYSYTQNS